MRALSHMRSSQSAPRRPVATTVRRARISHAPSGPATATPRHRSPSMSTWVHSVRKSRSTPASRRWRSIRAYRSRARSVPRWRSGQSTNLRPALIARRRISSTSGLRSAPSTRTSAPKPRYTPSTSPMASCASSRPMRSGRSPPTSADSDSFPSENAPAPENPVVIRQGSQFAHGAPACFGHTRSSTAKPLSTMTMRPVKPRSKRESAQKIPAGPAPTMTTSVSMVRISTLLFPRRSDGAIRVLHHCTPPAVGSSGIRRRERNSRSERMLRMRSSDAERGLPAKFL